MYVQYTGFASHLLIPLSQQRRRKFWCSCNFSLNLNLAVGWGRINLSYLAYPQISQKTVKGESCKFTTLSSPRILDKSQTVVFFISRVLVKSLINKSCHISRTVMLLRRNWNHYNWKQKCDGLKKKFDDDVISTD